MTDYNDIPPVDDEAGQKFNIEDMLHAVQRTVEDAEGYAPQLEKILDDFKEFLSNKPAPPASWLKQVGANASRFDYHQIVLPESLTDPYLDEEENMERLRNHYRDASFMALESELILRNRFLYIDGHCSGHIAPKPILMLESREESEVVDWDCSLSLFPDGSFLSYNLDKSEEEDIGTDGLDIIRSLEELIPHMQMRVPVEGYDYGELRDI